MRLHARLTSAIVVIAAVLAGVGTAIPRDKAVTPKADGLRAQSAVAREGMVVTQEKHASRIGADILAKGGNAVDAAVAVSFALAVTLPKAGNLGGGGFMMVHRADAGETVAIDFRETAPQATSRDVFLDEAGNADPEKSRYSGLAVGVPGTVAGLALAHADYGSGRFSFAELVAPAVRLAREGITVDEELQDSLQRATPRLKRWPSSARIFLKADGTNWSAGDILVQPELGETLETIGREGARAFYVGPIADAIVSAVRGAGGRMIRGDLENYRPLVRKPVHGEYRGYAIASMPPPSSGGIVLVAMLNLLEGFPLAKLGARSPLALHLMIETMKIAYADRAEFMGDPNSVDMPVERLLSKSYAAEQRATIDRKRARPAAMIRPDSSALGSSGGNTTHFSIVDRFGNAVANTTSLNFSYGVGMVAAGTGILLNNTLDDFAAKPGAPNAFGLIGGSANAPGPGKRPLSSMTPAIVFKDGKPALVTGAPGGSRIITTVLQVIVNYVDFGGRIAGAVSAPRVHHQWRPDVVLVESSLPEGTIRALERRGHTVRVRSRFGSAHSIAVTRPNNLVGAADRRARRSLAVGAQDDPVRVPTD